MTAIVFFGFFLYFIYFTSVVASVHVAMMVAHGVQVIKVVVGVSAQAI